MKPVLTHQMVSDMNQSSIISPSIHERRNRVTPKDLFNTLDFDTFRKLQRVEDIKSRVDYIHWIRSWRKMYSSITDATKQMKSFRKKRVIKDGEWAINPNASPYGGLDVNHYKWRIRRMANNMMHLRMLVKKHAPDQFVEEIAV